MAEDEKKKREVEVLEAVVGSAVIPGREAARGMEHTRFWPNVKIQGPDECWPWKAGRFSDGYGAFSFKGEDGRRGKVKKASRAVWILIHGDPGEKLVLHTCDNRLCVNPEHLYLGDHKQNMKDMAKRERASKGDKHWTRTHRTNLATGTKVGTSKLTEEQVKEIKRQYDATPFRGILKVLSDEYGVSKQMIHHIVKRKWWANVEPEKIEADKPPKDQTDEPK